MKRLCVILLLALTLVVEGSSPAMLYAQRPSYHNTGIKDMRWGVDKRGEPMLYVRLKELRIYSNRRDLRNYQRMVRAVRKVYPLAIEAAKRMESITVNLSELRRRDKRQYTIEVEEALKREITPMLWKMTRYEGIILLKLIDRETNQTAFSIVKDLRSGFTAGFYQALARIFGNNLKLEYDPTGEDAILEQIVIYYKAGLL